jgi:Glycosyltransferase family 87
VGRRTFGGAARVNRVGIDGFVTVTSPAVARLSALAVAVIALAVFVFSGPPRAPQAFVRGNAIDFNAAYCGVKVAELGSDPYRVEPLRRCEHEATPTQDHDRDWVVVPAPLPGYTFFLLRPLAHVPYDVAKALWVALGVLALLIASLCAARVTNVPAIAVLLVFAPSIGLLNLWYGEPVPLAIALLACAALAAHVRRDALAGILAALALLEPHVGLPACVGAFFALPRSRVALIAAGAVLGLLSLASLGPHLNLEYLLQALPAQARSEIAVNYQLSLAHVLSLTGLPTRTAVALGSLSYAVMTVLGTVIALRLVDRGYRAAAIWIPVTFAMLGGPYVHTVEIAAALPGALLLCTILEGRARVVAALGLAMLIVPWNPGATGNVANVPLALAATFVATALVLERTSAPLRSAALVTLALGIYLAAVPPATRAPAPLPARPASIHPEDLSSRAWTMFVLSSSVWPHEDVQHVMLKAPQWLGLLLTAGAALTVVRVRVPSKRRRATSERLSVDAGVRPRFSATSPDTLASRKEAL